MHAFKFLFPLYKGVTPSYSELHWVLIMVIDSCSLTVALPYLSLPYLLMPPDSPYSWSHELA